jgi:hypothetical protein
MNENLRYRAAPFHSVKARSGNRAVMQLATGERKVISEAAFLILDQLRGFRPLHEHAQIVARRISTLAGNPEGIRTTLDELRRQGLMVSDAEFPALSGAQPGSPANIRTIGIPCRRDSQLIERCVESYAQNARMLGREVRFLITGGERRPLATASVEWLDDAWREGLIDRLSRAGLDASVCRFALTGDAEGLPPGFARTTGANRNALLLATLGEPFLSADDDTLSTLTVPPAPKPGVTIQSTGTPFEMWFETKLPPGNDVQGIDLLAEAGRVLGPLGSVFGDLNLSAIEFEHATMRKLCGGHARARVAQAGLRGDAATDSPAGWLTAAGPTRDRLLASEGDYQTAMRSRKVLSIRPDLCISDAGTLMSYCAAFDNRTLLPPFPPLGRDQDGIFALWLSAADPSSVTACLPLAVLHEPVEARSFPEDAILRGAQGILLNDALRLGVDLGTAATTAGGVSERLQRLGSWHETLRSLPLAEFHEFLLERRLDLLARAIQMFEQCLSTFGSRPAWWARDIHKVVKACEQAMAGSAALHLTESGATRPIENEMAVLQQYVGWCGRLLREWPGICEVSAGG